MDSNQYDEDERKEGQSDSVGEGFTRPAQPDGQKGFTVPAGPRRPLTNPPVIKPPQSPTPPKPEPPKKP